MRLIVALGLLVALLLTGCDGHRSKPKEAWTLEQVHEVAGKNKTELFISAREWFASTFKDSKSVLEVQDKDAGLLMGKGYLPGVLDWGLGAVASLHISMKVEIKDGKYRFTCEALDILTSSGTVRELYSDSELKAAMDAIKKLDADLATAVSAQKKDF